MGEGMGNTNDRIGEIGRQGNKQKGSPYPWKENRGNIVGNWEMWNRRRGRELRRKDIGERKIGKHKTKIWKQRTKKGGYEKMRRQPIRTR